MKDDDCKCCGDHLHSATYDWLWRSARAADREVIVPNDHFDDHDDDDDDKDDNCDDDDDKDDGDNYDDDDYCANCKVITDHACCGTFLCRGAKIGQKSTNVNLTPQNQHRIDLVEHAICTVATLVLNTHNLNQTTNQGGFRCICSPKVKDMCHNLNRRGIYAHMYCSLVWKGLDWTFKIHVTMYFW